ncbi:nucleotidyltransferase domain-containing protein [Specibacter cremeus]|uniref:nucleotidyltransferase domain-containing protein n=1 Tax=Specibacter cremeus TaxID=1629051 RepID=UPI0013DDA287|nr:nucleotidyltransferase domain-containing protein [Specibacter cremeus]
MDLSHPADDLVGRNTSRVLQRLAMVPDGLTGRRLSELSGVPLGSTQRVLARLETVGLAAVRRAGRANLYSLNRDHVLWPGFERMLAAPVLVEHLIGDTVRQFAGETTAAAVYGSFARGEAVPDSDLDVLLVWGDAVDERAQEQTLSALHDRVGAATGNNVEIVDLSLVGLNRLVRADDPLVASWRREARTVSAGPDIRALIRSVA